MKCPDCLFSRRGLMVQRGKTNAKKFKSVNCFITKIRKLEPQMICQLLCSTVKQFTDILDVIVYVAMILGF